MITTPGKIIIGEKIRYTTGGGSAPTNNTPPSISGTAVVGQTLTVTAGGWSGSPTPTLSYQWYRGATPISGATSTTYTLVQADAGNTSNMKCVVTATNGAGSASADSNTVARVLDALANAYLTGLVSNDTEKNAVNQLYISLRANNYHTEADCIQIYANFSSDAQLKSIVGANPTLVNSPTFSRAAGSVQTGTSYINTNFVQTVSTKFTRLSNSLGYSVSNKNTTQAGGCGFVNGNSTFIVINNTAGVAFANYSKTQGSSAFVRTISNKNYGTKRTVSTDRLAYQDGVTNSAAIPAMNGAFNTQPMFAGAINNNGTAITISEAGSIVCAFWVGSSNIDFDTMYNIIDTYISSL